MGGFGTAAQAEGIAIARETVDAFKDRVYGFCVMPPSTGTTLP